MARFEIDKATVRNKLEPRREPYWGAPVERGLFLGFRRLEQGGNWVARFRTDEGKQVYQALGPLSPTNDYETAVREARRWGRGASLGVKRTDIETVADACLEYVDALKRDKRDSSAEDAQQRISRTVLCDPLGKVKLTKLRERHLEEWRIRLEQGGFTPLVVRGKRAAKPLSPATFKRNLTIVKAALNLAVRKRHVSPERSLEWESIRPEKDADGRRDLYLTKEQRRTLLAAVPDDLRPLVYCIALTGCRPGDPAAVRRRDYDGRNGAVTFTTKDHPRNIPLSPTAKALFDDLAKGKGAQELLFTQENGEPWTPRAWFKPVRDAVLASELPEAVVLYSLRHSWVTDAIVGGMDLLTVAKLVGTSLTMIEKHYGHLVHSAAREKLAALDFV